MNRLLSAFLLSLGTLSAEALDIPEIFSDNMIVQQQTEAKLWGWADRNSYVTVSTSWDGKTYTATVGDDGKWTAEVRTPEASFAQYTITIEERAQKAKGTKARKTQKEEGDAIDSRTIRGVMAGEVWFCSGQSNMEMPLGGFWNCPVEGANDAILHSARYSHAIRVVTVPKRDALEPQEKVEGRWEVCSPENAARFTACGYFFATTLVDALNVPVGIINCSWGGSCVEGWLPKDTLLTYPDGLTPMDDTDYHRKMVMFNGMLAPLAGYTIKGFLWNQGESNVGREKEYIDRFKTMTRLWRKMWRQPGDKLPIYTVELPPYRYGDVDGTSAADFRAAQHEIARQLEHCGCVCTADLIYEHEVDQIHGAQKRQIGERLALLALTRDYGMKGVAADAPEYEECVVTDADAAEQAVIAGTAVGNSPNAKGKVLHLYFSNSYDGFDRMAGIEGFEAQDSKGVWHKALAWSASAWQNVKRQGCFIALACPEADVIKAVRYRYHNFCIGTLHNMRGLPVVPFTAKVGE